MKTIALLALLTVLTFSGCASLPNGSTFDAGAGFSKDSGPNVTASIHIPLGGKKAKKVKQRSIAGLAK